MRPRKKVTGWQVTGWKKAEGERRKAEGGESTSFRGPEGVRNPPEALERYRLIPAVRAKVRYNKL